MRDVSVKGVVTSGLNIDFYYFGGEGNGHNPIVTGIYMRNVHFDEAYRAWNLYGFPDDKIGLVCLTDCTFDKVISNHRPTQNVSELQLVNVVIEGERIDRPL